MRTKNNSVIVLERKKKKGYGASLFILLSFLSIIFLGTFLLSLPGVAYKPLSLFEAFFTSTSISCVTGLNIVEMENFTRFGQWIILGLIQIGGLGFMTLSFFVISLFAGGLGFTGRSLAGEILNFDSLGKIRHFIFLIIQTTFIVELFGFLALLPHFSSICKTQEEAVFQSLFYSISAFCNAGISLTSGSVEHIFASKPILLTLSILVFLGGIGFFVFYEVFSFLKSKIFSRLFSECRRHSALSLHSKMVIKTTFSLILFGIFSFFILEKNNGLFSSYGFFDSIFHSFFYSVSLRNAGFLAFNLSSLKIASLFISMVLMLIGASPGSTGGGIKTTTFSVFMATLSSIMRGKTYVEVESRTIPTNQVYRSVSIVIVALFWIFASTFALLLSETGISFFDLLFEASSALSTTGISTGITKALSTFGQFVLIINMLAGRIGSLTLIFAIRQRYEKQPYKYPEEKVLIG